MIDDEVVWSCTVLEGSKVALFYNKNTSCSTITLRCPTYPVSGWLHCITLYIIG